LSIRYFTAGIIAVSQEIRDSFDAASIRTPSWTIPNGISIPELESDMDCADTKEKFGIPPGTLWLGSAIRLEPIKNPDLLLQMASILRAKSLSFCLSIFGDGSLKDKLEREIERLELQEYVKLHGHSTEVKRIMRCWDVFLLTSLHEGVPMSLLEAMSVSVVPVCTEVGGIPEVVQNDETGVLVPCNDASALSDAVQQLMLNETMRTRLGNNAELLIKEKYDALAMARKYLEVYQISIDHNVRKREPTK
jgi:glycosyltransferase involved in cell wall biosynthesis